LNVPALFGKDAARVAPAVVFVTSRPVSRRPLRVSRRLSGPCGWPIGASGEYRGARPASIRRRASNARARSSRIQPRLRASPRESPNAPVRRVVGRTQPRRLVVRCSFSDHRVPRCGFSASALREVSRAHWRRACVTRTGLAPRYSPLV